MYPIAILCGGKGTRLGLDKPKCLAAIGGRPFIEWQIEMLVRRGFDKIVLCVGHQGEEVWKALRGWRPGAALYFSFDGSTPLGTGGALKHALHLLGDNFWFTYGDTYLDIDYAAIEQRYWSLGLLVVNYPPASGMGNVQLDGGLVRFYDKDDPDMDRIDAGAGILSAQILKVLPQKFDMGAIFTRLALEDDLNAFEICQPIHEIGTPAALAETRAFLEGLHV